MMLLLLLLLFLEPLLPVLLEPPLPVLLGLPLPVLLDRVLLVHVVQAHAFRVAALFDLGTVYSRRLVVAFGGRLRPCLPLMSLHNPTVLARLPARAEDPKIPKPSRTPSRVPRTQHHHGRARLRIRHQCPYHLAGAPRLPRRDLRWRSTFLTPRVDPALGSN